MKFKEHYVEFKMVTVFTYGGVFLNLFSSHCGFIKKFESTPSMIMTGHKHIYVI